MALVGKLVSQVNIKSDGDVFHEIFRERPHHMCEMTPHIQNIDLHEGQWGKVGSVVFWNYKDDGKECVAKEIIEAIDEEKKSVTYKVIEGDLMELYKTFNITVHVDTTGDDNLVTWTFDYEKLNADVPEPKTLMDVALNVTKDIESHHLDNATKAKGLVGKMVSQIDIKSDGDVFHEIFRERPHHISDMSPSNIQKCDLHDGDWGAVGSVIYWNYTHDGKESIAKEIIEAVDEEKKSVTFKVIEGDLMELYKTFKLTVHVDTNGDDNIVTWTLDYEKLNKDVPDPQSLMDFCLQVTKDIETHHLENSTETKGLVGKMVSQIDIKSDGDVFHEIFRERPHHISDMSPSNIQNCDLHDGDWGAVGSVIYWNYTHDGKESVAKEIIEAVDEAKKSVTFKVIEGDLMELYKTFKLTVHVDTNGDDNIVTWTLEYEKLKQDVPDPRSLMDFCLQVTKDIETHHISSAAA